MWTIYVQKIPAVKKGSEGSGASARPWGGGEEGS